MTKSLFLLLGLFLFFGCKESQSLITIIDIAQLDRNGIAKELQVINKHDPKVIGLDFLLTTDSLEKDIFLMEELSKSKNLIQASKLHLNDPFNLKKWDSLEVYHSKFRFGKHGFSNLTIY